MANGVVSTETLLTIAVCATMLLCTSLNVVMKDLQTKLGFYHPSLWTAVGYVGQVFFLPVHYWTASDQAEKTNAKPAATLYTFVLVTTFSFAQKIAINMAYFGLPGSILQQMKALKIVFTVMFSTSILGKDFRKYQYFGVAMCILGVLIVGGTATGGSGIGWANTRHAAGGLVWAALNALIGAMCNVWVEKIMKQYDCGPALLTGMEGAIGIFYSAAWIWFTQALHIDDTIGAVKEMLRGEVFLWIFLFFIVTMVASNYSAKVVTWYTSAVMRSLLDVVKGFIVWAIEIACKWDRFSWVESIGFVIMSSGVLIYSKHLQVPCFSYEEAEPLLPVKQSESK